jgi:tRNA threonylcarbamoyladenosine biosynthesis protein TsaE
MVECIHMKKQIQTLEELHDLAREVIATLLPREGATIIALKGDLGAGKTAFVKAVAKQVGITHEITSPTFVIMKSYEIPAHAFFKTLIHMDAYRIEDEDEMRVLKFGEILSDQSSLVCIEWPEKIQNLIPEGAYEIEFMLNQDGTRDITYSE